MELLGDEVKLKSADDSDVDDLYAWWNDSEFSGDYASVEPKKTVRDIEEMVKKGKCFIILSRSEAKKIGFIDYYLSRSDYAYLFEIGYRIKPSERRKGYTTEAARLLIDYLFATKDIERIEAVTETGNVPSQRVLEKNGFKREGELRKRALNVNGEYKNEYMYSLLREEWQSLRAHSSPEMHQSKS